MTTYKSELLYALNQQKIISGTYLSGAELTSSNLLFDEIISIVDQGLLESDPIIINDPPDYDIGYFNAKRLMTLNKEFIQTEIIAWISDQIQLNAEPFGFGFNYDAAACERDVGYIIDALTYDITYGGNLATYDAASAYFVGISAQYGQDEKEETIAAYERLRDILSDILQGVLITPSSGNDISQDTSGDAGSSEASALVSARVTEIIDTLSADGVLPSIISPDITWSTVEKQTAFDALIENKRSIANSVMRNLMKHAKTLLGAFIYSFEDMQSQIFALPDVDAAAETIISSQVEALINTLLDPKTVNEPSTITAIGHTWTAIMAGVALTKIPPARNFATIQESILELEQGLVIASGQDDQGSALFIGGMEINADTGELTGPPFEKSVNRIATRTAIARSF
jgi:hypothetical protein